MTMPNEILLGVPLSSSPVCQEPEPEAFEEGGSSSMLRAQPNPPMLASREVPPRISTFLQNASHFNMEQANFNNSLQIVTINRYDHQADPLCRGCRLSPAFPPSRSPPCACAAKSSHVIASLNTPTQQLRFEYSQQDIGPSLHRYIPADQAHDHIAVQDGTPTRQSEDGYGREGAVNGHPNQLSAAWSSVAVNANKGHHRDSEDLHCSPDPQARNPLRAEMAEPDCGLVVGEALTTIFGEEYSRGIEHALRDCTLCQPVVGVLGGQPIRSPSRFLPHYNGLSRKRLLRLDTSVKVVLARVVEKLRRERRELGLCRPLTFEAVQSCLSQLVFLQTSTGDVTTSFQTAKCQRASRLSRFMTEATWIVELVGSEEPGPLIEQAFATLKTRKSKQRKKQRSLPAEIQPCGDDGLVVLIDLTVLCFPRQNIPRFKLCHLLVKCFTAKKGGFSSKPEVRIVVDYTSRFYHVRDGVVDRLTPEARHSAVLYAESLFLDKDSVD